MKRSFYGLLGFAVLVINFLVAMPALALTQSEAEAACQTFGGHITIINVNTAGLAQWSCTKNSGTTTHNSSESSLRSSLKSACESVGGTYSETGSSSGYNWKCNGLGSVGFAMESGGGSNGGSTDSGGTSSGAPTSIVVSGSTPDDGCGGVPTSLIKCSSAEDGTAIFNVLAIALNVVTYGVGAAAILGVIITGYQYMSARDNVAQVAKAKNRLLQVVIGLAVWILFWGVLQFLLPGGLLANGS